MLECSDTALDCSNTCPYCEFSVLTLELKPWLQGWSAKHHLLSDAIEFICIAADNSIARNLGYLFVSSEGNHANVAQRIAAMLRPLRVCHGCLRYSLRCVQCMLHAHVFNMLFVLCGQCPLPPLPTSPYSPIVPLLTHLRDAWEAAKDSVGNVTALEAEVALQKAMDGCDLFCADCEAGGDVELEGGGCEFHSSSDWTRRRCECCVNKGRNCHKVVVRFVSMDCCGEQAGFIRRAFEGVWDDTTANLTGSEWALLRAVRCIPDGAHTIKSTASGVTNHKICLKGSFCGNFQLWSRFHDADRGRRDAVRQNISRAALRGKNRFSVEQMVERRERALQLSLMSPAERQAGEALIISTVGPARDKQWSANVPTMYDLPMGGVFDYRYNLYYYVDTGLKQLRVIKVSHSPADNEIIVKSSLRRPIAVALIDGNLYVTDANFEQPCIWVVDVSAVRKRFSAAAAQVANGKESTLIQKLILSGEPMQEPYGIVAFGTTQLYVTDRAGMQVVRIILASVKEAHAELIALMPKAPAGIDVEGLSGGTVSVFVAAGDSIYLLSIIQAISADAAVPLVNRPLLQQEGAQFCGVNVAPSTLGGDLFIINQVGNSLLRLTRISNAPLAFSTETQLLAGGNADFPQGVWYEGTSSKVTLWGPTFGAFAGNSFIFSNSGRGGRFGKVLLLSDLFPMVGILMPALCKLADAFRLSEGEANHAYNWAHASSLIAEVRDVFDMIEEDNFNLGRPRGEEGVVGNFSNVCRRSLRQLSQLLEDDQVELAQWGVPERVLNSLNVKSLMTLVVERFFSVMRARWPNPYALQYQANHAIAMMLQAFASGCARGFTYFTGASDHYTEDGSSKTGMLYAIAKPKSLDITPSQRAHALTVLQKFAATWKQVRQQRVMDKSKEQVADRPSVTFDPAAVFVEETPMLQIMDAYSLTAEGSRGNTSNRGQSGIEHTVLYLAGDVVTVKGTNKSTWLAQMEDNLVKMTVAPAKGRGKPTVKYNVERPKVRYFVLTRELQAWPLAAEYWGDSAVQEAQCVAESSNGISFSFEKRDSASIEAIYGSVVHSERVRDANDKLIRFTISESDYQDLTNLVNDLGESSTVDVGSEALIEWQYDHDFVHKHVAVLHDGKVSQGLITKWAPSTEDGDVALWHMMHSDGDEEDLEEAEVIAAMALYAEEAGTVEKTQQTSSYSGRKRSAFNVAALFQSRGKGKKAK